MTAPPVTKALAVLKFVTTPVVALNVVNPLTAPPVICALPELKFVATAVVVPKLVAVALAVLNPVVAINVPILPLVAFKLAELKFVTTPVVLPKLVTVPLVIVVVPNVVVPVTPSVPLICTPVALNAATFELATPTVIMPPELAMFTLLVPLTIVDVLTVVHCRPVPVACNNWPA